MWTFRAMTTDVTITAPTLDDAAERALAAAIAVQLAELERRYSRFDPDSELARLNAAATPIEVSPELFALLERGREHARATAGVFEPAVATALRAWGYDRSFAPGALDRADAPAARASASIAELSLDARTRRVARPPGVAIDLAGFLKGLAVDRAVALAPPIVAIDAGGDAALRGAPPGARGWTVAIEDPHDRDRELAEVVVRDTAVATSGPSRRHWHCGTELAHHLIDPRTGAPARTDLAQATVFAPTVEEADVMAKVAFVLGGARGAAALEARGLRGVLIARDGSLRVVGALEVHHA